MKQHLLIANSDAVLCEVYRRFLADRGYEVEASTNGLDCVAKLRRLPPAVLVLDLELLWGGGDGVLAWLREQSPAPGIPVLLTATAADPADLAEYHKPPVVDCLPRPFALAGLLESIRSAAARRARAEPTKPGRVAG